MRYLTAGGGVVGLAVATLFGLGQISRLAGERARRRQREERLQGTSGFEWQGAAPLPPEETPSEGQQ